MEFLKDHDHERLIVNTRAVPFHRTDKVFSRSWENLKREDPAQGCELWALKDLADHHESRRIRLQQSSMLAPSVVPNVPNIPNVPNVPNASLSPSEGPYKLPPSHPPSPPKGGEGQAPPSL